MKKLLRKKADPPQQPAPPPAVHKPPQPPPLFARFASSQSSNSSTSPPVISGPVPLAPRDSLNRQTGAQDGSPPKPSSPRVLSAPIQRNRVFEKQQPVSGGRDDRPLPDLEQAPPQRYNLQTFHRGPAQSFEPRTPPMAHNDLPPKPLKSVPEFRKREDPSRNAEFVPVPIKSRSGGMTNKLTRTPVSSSPERKLSPQGPPPVTELPPSGLLGSQHPPDRLPSRRKYSPLEAFGLVSGESSPVPSTTTSSVNLTSQGSNSVSTTSNFPTPRSYSICFLPF